MKLTVTVTIEDYTYSTDVEYVMQGAFARIIDSDADRIYAELQRDREAYLLPCRVSDFFEMLRSNLQEQVDSASKLRGNVEVLEWRIWVYEKYDALEGEGGKWEGKSSLRTLHYTVQATAETPGAFAYEVRIGEKTFINYEGKNWQDFAEMSYYENRMLPEFDFRDSVVQYPPAANGEWWKTPQGIKLKI